MGSAFVGVMVFWLALKGQFKQKLKEIMMMQQGVLENIGTWFSKLSFGGHKLSQTEKSIKHYKDALGIHQQIGNRLDECNDLASLANAYSASGQVNKAVGHYKDALVIAREIGAKRNQCVLLANLGLACHDLGEIDKARQYMQASLAIFTEIKSPVAEVVQEWLNDIEVSQIR